jgi:hypothetical protein
MDEPEQGNNWVVLVFLTILGLQIGKYYLNLFVGKQFYPNANSYDDQMRKMGKDGNDIASRIPRGLQRDAYIEERRIKGGIMYPTYIYFLIPFWLELPQTKRGRIAGNCAGIISLPSNMDNKALF